jgi:DNA-binding IclR family transcriptional regulator
VVDGWQVIVIHREPPDHGTPLKFIEAAPRHCTSTGKSILAFQPNAKIDAIIAGIRCVGAPIRDRAGRVIAGLSVSGPTRGLPKAKVTELAKIVVHQAKLIETKL